MKKQLGEVEHEVLKIVWKLKEASVNEVLNEIRKTKDVAYTTVMTILQVLTKKNYLSYKKEGRSYIYFAKVEQEEVKKSFLTKLVQNVFSGSSVEVVQFMIKNESISEGEKKELKKLIDEMD